jgi:excisionase family DNA binding protein
MYRATINSINRQVDKSKGELLSVKDAAERAQISESTMKRLIQNGYVDAIKIGTVRFVYYRDLLRGAWEYECSKERPGRRPANSKYND